MHGWSVRDLQAMRHTPEPLIVFFERVRFVAGQTTGLFQLADGLQRVPRSYFTLVAAVDQLRTYAGLMGIPFRFVDQVQDLVHTLEENKQRDYILIDTACCEPEFSAVKIITTRKFISNMYEAKYFLEMFRKE